MVQNIDEQVFGGQTQTQSGKWHFDRPGVGGRGRGGRRTAKEQGQFAARAAKYAQRMYYSTDYHIFYRALIEKLGCF